MAHMAEDRKIKAAERNRLRGICWAVYPVQSPPKQAGGHGGIFHHDLTTV